jgi:hypothetical protein
MIRLAQAIASGTADIDIGGQEFDFVRSIKVWQVEYRHRYTDRNGCIEYDNARHGFYGTQGDYRMDPILCACCARLDGGRSHLPA